MTSEKVKELAETLKKQGLAASMYEAMEKAQRIIGDEGETEKKEIQEESPKEEQNIEQQKPQQEKEGFFEKIKDKITHKEEEKSEQPDYDISEKNATVNELMEELGVNPEEVKEIEKEKIEEDVGALKQEIEDAGEEGKEMKGEKIEEIKKKIEEIKEEADELEEEQ